MWWFDEVLKGEMVVIGGLLLFKNCLSLACFLLQPCGAALAGQLNITSRQEFQQLPDTPPNAEFSSTINP